MSNPEYWRKCSSCKEPISYGAQHYICGISTCNRKRTGMVFCSMPCWSRHNPVMMHRDPWAERKVAPTQAEAAALEAAPRRTKTVREPGAPDPDRPNRYVAADSVDIPRPPLRNAKGEVVAPLVLSDGDLPEDVLVVVSKLKSYIVARSGMKTSASCSEALSDIIRAVCDEAVQQAHADGRKTVMGRDFKGL